MQNSVEKHLRSLLLRRCSYFWCHKTETILHDPWERMPGHQDASQSKGQASKLSRIRLKHALNSVLNLIVSSKHSLMFLKAKGRLSSTWPQDWRWMELATTLAARWSSFPVLLNQINSFVSQVQCALVTPGWGSNCESLTPVSKRTKVTTSKWNHWLMWW